MLLHFYRDGMKFVNTQNTQHGWNYKKHVARNHEARSRRRRPRAENFVKQWPRFNVFGACIRSAQLL